MTRARGITPRGRAAIAGGGVEGPDALAAIDGCFHPSSRKAITGSPVDRIRFGTWQRRGGEELVVVPTSRTRAEVHCHGGSAAAAAILASLAEKGVDTQASPLGPRPLEDAARMLVPFATTERTAGILLDQMAGALTKALETLREAVDRRTADDTVQILDQLLRFAPLAGHLTTPWRVVLTGPPNVGKSSLINALAGYERALVFDQPGTTRDVVTTVTAIDGWPVELADTAGLRESDDPVEQAGVALARAERARADVTIVVRAASDLSEPIDGRSTQLRRVRVANKRDLAPTAELAAGEIATVAPSGEGVSELIDAIGRALALPEPDVGQAVPFERWHVEQLSTLREQAIANRWDEAAASLLALTSPRDFDD